MIRARGCLLVLVIFSLRYFRSEDRNIHEKSYPELYYPEIYLLEGGYKAFYEYSKVRHDDFSKIHSPLIA